MNRKFSIVLGSDHNGVDLKIKLKAHLEEQGFTCIDVGPHNNQLPVDYTDYAFLLGKMIAEEKAQCGILICGTGVGMSIAANRLRTIRAALVHNSMSAKKSREHNNANVLCLGTWINDDETNISLTDVWLAEAFGGGRHINRVEKIDFPPQILSTARSSLRDLREELFQLHLEIYHHHLVVGSSGNISIRDPNSNLVVIKPSGVTYKELTPEHMVIVSMDGKVVEGHLRPSVDTSTHLYIYRNRSDIHGIVHTHSPYATAFAAVDRSIPPVITSIADEFGGPIPCGEYVGVGSDAIGKVIVNSIGSSHAILMKQHGVFTIGSSGKHAVQSAIKVEEMAKTVYFANQLGTLEELSTEEITEAHYRYRKNYGQH